MAKHASQPPAPVVHAFLVCREVLRDERTRDAVLIAPGCFVPVGAFPANIKCSVFLLMTGGHGNYQVSLSLNAVVLGCSQSYPSHIPR